MGRMQREKGKRFERLIADELRRRWPEAVVRRASQAERADNPDVFCEGIPVLERLWLELQDARAPTPEAKLAQAEADVLAWQARRGFGVDRLGPGERWPIVVWHRLGERTTYATTRLCTLLILAGGVPLQYRVEVVTMDLAAMLDLIAECCASEIARAA